MTAGGRVRETTRRGGPSGRRGEVGRGRGRVRDALGGERDRADRRRRRRPTAPRARPSRRGRARRTRGCRRAGRRSRPASWSRRARSSADSSERIASSGRAGREAVQDQHVGAGVARGLELLRIGDRRADLQQQLAGGRRERGRERGRRGRGRRRRRSPVSPAVPGVGVGGQLLDLGREAPGREVGERDALEHVAQAGPGRDPDVGEPRRGAGVGDGSRARRRAPRRAGRRRRGSRRRRSRRPAAGRGGSRPRRRGGTARCPAVRSEPRMFSQKARGAFCALASAGPVTGVPGGAAASSAASRTA